MERNFLEGSQRCPKQKGIQKDVLRPSEKLSVEGTLFQKSCMKKSPFECLPVIEDLLPVFYGRRSFEESLWKEGPYMRLLWIEGLQRMALKR